MVILVTLPWNKSNKRAPTELDATDLKKVAIEMVRSGLYLRQKMAIVIGD